MNKKKLSFIIPCYCSEKTITGVVEKILETVQLKKSFLYEIILINDGSPDNTFQVISAIAQQEENIIAVDLSKNFGQHSALMAGYSIASGDYIIGLDDDGEHNPKDMFKLIDELEKGYDYVCADFPKRKRSFIKGIGSKINNWMATKLIGKPKDIDFSSYYIMRKYVVDEIVKCKNPFPYVGGLIIAITKNVSTVPIQSYPRKSGRSGYNIKNSLSLWLNGFTAFSVKPLRIATVAGFIMAMVGFIYGVFIIIRKLLEPSILSGYASTMSVLLFVGGMLMITLGLVGEYVGRIYISINKLPQYVVKQVVTKVDESLKEED